jgi:hypothetical protein
MKKQILNLKHFIWNLKIGSLLKIGTWNLKIIR